MIKDLLVVIVLTLLYGHVSAQYYEVSFKKEIAPMAIGVGVTTLAVVINNNSAEPQIDEINLLDVNNLNFLDRGVINNSSQTAQDLSDVLLYGSIALPFVTYTTANSRSNGGAIILMIAETALINNGITNIIKGTAARYRPFNYNPAVDIQTKLGSGSRKSFVSGHTSNVTAFSFLTARIITDLHPEMSHKYIVWGTAITIPAVVGYLRVSAGKHFPTDVIGGYILGASVGYLIPRIHLKNNKNLQLTTAGISGFNLSLKF